MAKGVAGTVFLTTDDVHADYEQLKARGVEFTEAPEERPYGIDSGFRDPSGNSFRLTQVTEIAPPCSRRVPTASRAGPSAPCSASHSRARTASTTARPPGDDGDDLELHDVLPVGDPRLQQRDVVALHHLEHAA